MWRLRRNLFACEHKNNKSLMRLIAVTYVKEGFFQKEVKKKRNTWKK